MVGTRMVASGLLVALVVSGCAVSQENYNPCRVGWILLGAAAGGVGAGVSVGEGVHDVTDAQLAGAAAGGTVAGGFLGWLAGRYICQVEEAPPPPPPPAPPPAPPVTQRRGG